MSAARPERLLIDTCVWLDVYLGERPHSDDARRLVDMALERDIVLMYAATTVKDVHYLVAQTLKRDRRAAGQAVTEVQARADNETAWACVDNMGQIATAVGMDMSDIWLAEHYKRVHPDIEDNLVGAAALRAKTDILVTDDVEFIRHAPVAALTPGDAVALLEVLG